MGVMDPSLAPPIPPGADQDAILRAVGDEITNRGFVIAKARGIESGDTVMVYSDRVPSLKETTLGIEGSDYSFTGQMKAGNVELTRAAVTGVAMVTRHIKKGILYMDFLHTSQPANALEGRIVDWISGNYNYKMGVAKVKKIGESPYKRTFRTMSFAPRDIT